jgi:hypothetical protein
MPVWPDISILTRKFVTSLTVSEQRVTDSADATLLSGVKHIVGTRTEKQVRGINAWGIIATMQNPKAIRDRAEVNLP